MDVDIGAESVDPSLRMVLDPTVAHYINPNKPSHFKDGAY